MEYLSSPEAESRQTRGLCKCCILVFINRSNCGASLCCRSSGLCIRRDSESTFKYIFHPKHMLDEERFTYAQQHQHLHGNCAAGMR